MKKLYFILSFIGLLQLVTIIKASAQAPRQYYTNRAIPGTTEDSKGANYLLLHKIYTDALIDDHHVMGKITAIRGGISGWNRKWTVEVNTASAYNATRGSIICYNEAASLVTLTYNGESYLAISIINSSSLYYFSFTGYAQNESLTIVYDDNVSNVQSFTGYDPVSIQGNVGIGIGSATSPARLHVAAPQGTTIARFSQLAAEDSYLSIENSTAVTDHFIPAIKGRSSASGRPYGVSLVGEAEDIVPSGGEISGGAIILDGRSKNASSLVNNNVLMVNSYNKNLVAVKANGSVGIGTTTTGVHKLAVEGSIGARKVKVSQAGWADFVFHPDYQLPSLYEIEKYIKANRHLPGIPTAAEVEQEGLDLGETNRKLLQKIEELTLYLIIQQKQIDQLKQQNEAHCCEENSK